MSKREETRNQKSNIQIDDQWRIEWTFAHKCQLDHLDHRIHCYVFSTKIDFNDCLDSNNNNKYVVIISLPAKLSVGFGFVPTFRNIVQNSFQIVHRQITVRTNISTFNINFFPKSMFTFRGNAAYAVAIRRESIDSHSPCQYAKTKKNCVINKTNSKRSVLFFKIEPDKHRR